ncbi:hypothetical protein JIN84_13955 [Luteolibacter yonseiensis]|uniref:Uncharacterized protein n=1 Tax=Luteolibacter yonseiensis TaxID=1144680 RepID=A0A934VC25_9BACT|nr:hypothetical protein [Luteolibacter yonseiensis]MBK1816725.1 hypothetical protein [Luteolibacter yonseiensis]
MKKTIFFAMFSTALAVIPAHADVDCIALSASVKKSVVAEQSKVLEIVSAQVAASPGCACEIVKVAIEESKANSEMVAAIVEAASVAAPDQMRLVSQCAVAVAPDALAAVQAVVAKLDPNSGESGTSAKSSKDAEAAPDATSTAFNPLDFPGQGPIGPPPGAAVGPGGIPLVPMIPPIIIAPPDNPDGVTDPDAN